MKNYKKCIRLWPDIFGIKLPYSSTIIFIFIILYIYKAGNETSPGKVKVLPIQNYVKATWVNPSYPIVDGKILDFGELNYSIIIYAEGNISNAYQNKSVQGVNDGEYSTTFTNLEENMNYTIEIVLINMAGSKGYIYRESFSTSFSKYVFIASVLQYLRWLFISNFMIMRPSIFNEFKMILARICI